MTFLLSIRTFITIGLLVQNQQGTGAVMQQCVGYASEYEASQSSAPVRAHQNQIRVGLLMLLDDGLDRRAKHRIAARLISERTPVSYTHLTLPTIYSV